MKKLNINWALVECVSIWLVSRSHENEPSTKSGIQRLFYGKQTRIVFDAYGSMPTKLGILILLPGRI